MESEVQQISTRQKIIKEAMRLFNRDGWRHVTVRDISSSLDISPGNLSYHFPRKEDLIKTILQLLWSSEMEGYRKLYLEPVTIGHFLTILQNTFRNQLDNHGTLSIRYFFSEELTDEDGLSIEDSKNKIFREIIDKLVLENEIAAEAEDITFMVSFLIMFSRSWIMDHSLDGDKDIHRYLYLIAQQFYYFATDKGMQSIDLFLENL